MFPKKYSIYANVLKKNNAETEYSKYSFKSSQTFSFRPLIVSSREYNSSKNLNNFLLSLLDKTKIKGITNSSQLFLSDVTTCSSIISRQNADLYIPTVETMSTNLAKEFNVWIERKKVFNQNFQLLNNYFFYYENELKVKLYTEFLLESVLEEQEIARWFEEELVKETGLSKETLLIRLTRSLLDNNLDLFDYKVKPVKPEILYKLNKLTHLLLFLNEDQKSILSKYKIFISDEAKHRPYKLSVRNQLLTQYVSINAFSKKYSWTLMPNNASGLGDYFYTTPNSEVMQLIDIKSWGRVSDKKAFNRICHSQAKEIIGKYVTQKKIGNMVIGVVVTSGMERFGEDELELSFQNAISDVIKKGTFAMKKHGKPIMIDPTQAKDKIRVKFLNVK